MVCFIALSYQLITFLVFCLEVARICYRGRNVLTFQLLQWDIWDKQKVASSIETRHHIENVVSELLAIKSYFKHTAS